MYTYIFLLIDLFKTSLLALPAALGLWGRRRGAGRILPLQTRCWQDTSLGEGTGWWAMGRGMQTSHVPSGTGVPEGRVPCFGCSPKTTASACESSKWFSPESGFYWLWPPSHSFFVYSSSFELFNSRSRNASPCFWRLSYSVKMLSFLNTLLRHATVILRHINPQSPKLLTSLVEGWLSVQGISNICSVP